MRCQDSRVVQLEQLRCGARSKGREWLGSALQDINWKEVRELAQAAGLQTRYEDSNHSWMSVGDLRAALLEHVETEPAAAPEEFAAFDFVLFLVISCNGVIVRMSGSPMRSSARKLTDA